MEIKVLSSTFYTHDEHERHDKKIQQNQNHHQKMITYVYTEGDNTALWSTYRWHVMQQKYFLLLYSNCHCQCGHCLHQWFVNRSFPSVDFLVFVRYSSFAAVCIDRKRRKWSQSRPIWSTSRWWSTRVLLLVITRLQRTIVRRVLELRDRF